jgi:Flp pilus assembly protein TadG
MRSRRQRGQGLVEIALVLPVFLLIVLGTIDFGRAIYIYSVMSNGAREGARYAIVHGSKAQSIDGSCASGPGTVTTDTLGALVVKATGASAPGWAAVPAGCAAPVTVPPVGLDLSVYAATVCWGDECTVPNDCGAAGTNAAPRTNDPDQPVTVRTCYRFRAILPSLFGVGPIPLAAETQLYIAH